MDPFVPNNKFESGVFIGTPETVSANTVPQKTQQLIRTMKSDMTEAIKEQHETAVSIAIAEEKKKAAQAKERESSQSSIESSAPSQKRVGRFVVIIIVLLFLAALGFAYVYVLPKLGGIKLPSISFPSLPSFGNKTPETTAQKGTVISLAPSLLPAQSEKRFDIGKETQVQVYSEVGTEMETPISANSIKNLYFFKTTGATSAELTSNQLLSFANLQTPDILLRSLKGPFMTGLLGENGNTTPFVVLKVSDHDTALAGMLSWEQNLSSFIESNFSTASTTPSSKKFRDIIVAGQNARALDTSFGKTIAYAFADQNTIIISGSTTSLDTLLSLATKK